MRKVHLTDNTKTARIVKSIYCAIRDTPGLSSSDLWKKVHLSDDLNPSTLPFAISTLMLADNTPIEGERQGRHWHNLRAARPLPETLVLTQTRMHVGRKSHEKKPHVAKDHELYPRTARGDGLDAKRYQMLYRSIADLPGCSSDDLRDLHADDPEFGSGDVVSRLLSTLVRARNSPIECERGKRGVYTNLRAVRPMPESLLLPRRRTVEEPEAYPQVLALVAQLGRKDLLLLKLEVSRLLRQ